MAVTYKDIDLLTQKSAVAGTEKLPVSDTEYITPSQIAGTVNNVPSATKLQTARMIWGQSFDGTGDVNGALTATGSNGGFILNPGYASGEGVRIGVTTSGGALISTGLAILLDGSVGIGTSSPTAKLEIHSKIKLTDDTGTLSIGQWDGSTNRVENTGKPLLITSYSQPVQIGRGGDGNDIYVATSGYVGIGTTTPSNKLHVNGNAYASSFIKSDGTSSQFLKADGSVDSNTYATTTDLANAVGNIETLLAAI